MPRPKILILALTLAACGKPPNFAGTTPTFDPLKFWAGHHRSWGVMEGRDGAPTDIVTTECQGTPAANGSLDMAQTLTLGDSHISHRNWHLWRNADGTYGATANDMVGEAHGTANGRVFHWSWVLALGKNPLKHVVMDQWMYLYPDGTMMNRTTISKIGVIVAEVSERFE